MEINVAMVSSSFLVSIPSRAQGALRSLTNPRMISSATLFFHSNTAYLVCIEPIRCRKGLHCCLNSYCGSAFLFLTRPGALAVFFTSLSLGHCSRHGLLG